MNTSLEWRPYQQKTFFSNKNVYVCEERNKADMKQWCLNKHQIGSCYAINHILSQSVPVLFDSPVMWVWLWRHVTLWLVLWLDECFESCVFLTIFSGERKFYDANLVLEPGQAQVQPGLRLKTFRAPVSFIFIFFLLPCTGLISKMKYHGSF